MSEPLTMTARADMPLKVVHQALTDPQQMRLWLAEQAECDLPARYAFWGRHVPEGDAPHQHLLHTDDRTLRFSWTLAGQDTTVEIGLAEERTESTLITLSQTGFDFAHPGALGMLQTFWALSIANLVDHVEGRPLTPKCDYSTADLRGVVVITASIAEVYDSLINSGKVSRWFGFPLEIDPQVGGQYGYGKILDLEPGHSLTIGWGETNVTTWELDGSGGKTTITLVQSGFDDRQPPYAAWAGGLCGLAELRRFHELPNWQPIWQHEETSS